MFGFNKKLSRGVILEATAELTCSNMKLQQELEISQKTIADTKRELFRVTTLLNTLGANAGVDIDSIVVTQPTDHEINKELTTILNAFEPLATAMWIMYQEQIGKGFSEKQAYGFTRDYMLILLGHDILNRRDENND